jgi:hypothetical protein
MATKRARKTTKRGTTSKKTKRAAKKSGARSTPNVSLRNQLVAVVTAIDKRPALIEQFPEIEILRDALPNAIHVLERNPGAAESEITGPRP